MKENDKKPRELTDKILLTIIFGGMAISVLFLGVIAFGNREGAVCLLTALIVVGPLLLVIIGALFAQSKKESES